MKQVDGLIALTSVLVLGIGAQWIAWRIRLPSILVLLLTGFVAGPVLGFLNPDELLGPLLVPIVSMSVALILFEGGLTLKGSELRQIGLALVGLLTVGVIVTWVLATVAAMWLMSFTLGPALLLGSILTVTGPTVIGPLLQYIRPVGRVGAIAKWESIIVDPVGAILAVLVFEALDAVRASGYTNAGTHAAWSLMWTIVAGGASGIAGAGIVYIGLRRFWIPDFLHSPALMMMVLASFGFANKLQHESGLLAVTIMGLILANQRKVAIRHIVEFKENLRVVLISSVFVLLAARVDPMSAFNLGWGGLAFVAVLILVIRPASVFAATLLTSLSFRERCFLSWFAPRGIVAASVASVFALRLPPEVPLVPTTFLVVVATVAVYGLTAAPLARWLQLASASPQGILFVGADDLVRAIAKAVRDVGVAVVLVDKNRQNVATARLEGLDAVHADVLDMQPEDLPLGGIGRLLALTPNDEVNVLSALEFRELFGRSQIYQLASASRSAATPSDRRGRTLFGPDISHADLADRLEAGAVVKTTPLTKNFDESAYRNLYGDNAIVLFVLNENRQLVVCSTENRPALKAGRTVIALVNPSETPKPAGNHPVDGSSAQETIQEPEANAE